jgi:hypothetical protein
MRDMERQAFTDVRSCIETIFRSPDKNPRRRDVERLLPNLKSGEKTYRDLGDVITQLEPLCSGGFYASGDEFRSLAAAYEKLSPSEQDEVNRLYKQKVEEFDQASKQVS